MHLREELSSLFDYEQWATLRWIEPARTLGEEHLLVHIVQAQTIWLGRVEGRPPGQPSAENLAMDLERSVRNWKRFLLGGDLGQIVTYINSEGRHFENTALEIARQVINHGTYHRGQLRGIAGERGVPFPETDYIAYCRETSRIALR